MWSCKDVSERASDRLEGRLTLRERIGLRVHLAMCVHCRRYLRQFADTVRLLREIPDGTSDQEGEAQALGAFRRLHGRPPA